MQRPDFNEESLNLYIANILFRKVGWDKSNLSVFDWTKVLDTEYLMSKVDSSSRTKPDEKTIGDILKVVQVKSAR